MKILFVCTGNICRSPMAEGILKDRCKKLNVPVEADSAGFESFHVGDMPDPRAIQVTRKNGIDITGHRARLFNSHDFDRFDRIYIMDTGHYRNSMGYARNEADREKVDYIMNILYPGGDISVPDPWYHEMDAFEKVYKQLDEACSKLARDLAEKTKKQPG